jgi:Na+/proline symporter
MPQTQLQIIDWVVIGGYFVVLIAIALYYRRFAGRSLDDFFLAGRRNSAFANGLSYSAAMMNADVAPAYSGFAVATGLFVCWFYLSRFGVALFIGALLFAVFWRRLNLFTAPEFYELRFGGFASRLIRSWVAVKSSLIAMVAWTGTGLLAMYKIAGPVLGVGKTETMLAAILIVLAYVTLSGFSGVVTTAAVQTLIMLVGSAMLCGIVLYEMGGPTELASQLQQTSMAADALRVIPPTEHGVLPLAAALAWMLGTSIGYGGDAAPLGGAMEGQYVLSSRNTREASKMYIVAEVSLFLMLLLVTLPSLAAAVKWPGLRLPPGVEGHIDREKAYGLLMAEYLPPGMLGLLFVVMLASVMSTIGSNLTFGAQVLVSDIYRRHVQPQASERRLLWIGRGATLLILGLALVVAYSTELIFSVAAFMVAASAAEMPANWAQWWWWRFNRWGRVAASFGGMVFAVLIWFVLPTSAWEWWDKTYLVIATNTVFWVAVTLLTPPDEDTVLDRFYASARPLGAWRPVRQRALGLR